MPHLAELQKEYSDSIQIISISDESLEKVEKFLEREVRGEEDMTYAELTGSYCLTTDPDESVKQDYFRAAGRSGIPCAYIVGKGGIVEWIGHPMAMDKPLKQIVNDEWDRDDYMIKFKKEQEERAARKKAQAAMRKASRELQSLIRKKDFDGAVEKIDGMIKDKDYAQMKDQLMAMKVQMMVQNNMDGAAKALDKFAKANSKDVNLLNTIAWDIYEQHEKDGEVSKRLLKSACRCAEMAADEDPENGAVLDTYAHLVYAAFDDVDKAIEIQKRAVEHAGSQIDQIQPFLDELMKKKEDK
jgi:tetratricopeptide (TPR) repeat protein